MAEAADEELLFAADSSLRQGHTVDGRGGYLFKRGWLGGCVDGGLHLTAVPRRAQ